MSEALATIEVPAVEVAAPSQAEIGGNEAVLSTETLSSAESPTLTTSREAVDFAAWEAELADAESTVTQHTTDAPSIHLNGLAEINLNAADRAQINEGPVSLPSLQNSVDYQTSGVAVDDTQTASIPDAMPQKPTDIVIMDVISADIAQNSLAEHEADSLTTILPNTVPVTVENISLLTSQTATDKAHSIESESTVSPEDAIQDANKQVETQALNTESNIIHIPHIPSRWSVPTETTVQPVLIEPVEAIVTEDAVQRTNDKLDAVTVSTVQEAVATPVPVSDEEPNVQTQLTVEDPQIIVREQLAKEYQTVTDLGNDTVVKTEGFLEKVTAERTPWEPEEAPSLIDDEEEFVLQKMRITNTEQTVSEGTALLQLLEDREEKKKKLTLLAQQTKQDVNKNSVSNLAKEKTISEATEQSQQTDKKSALLLVLVKEKVTKAIKKGKEIRFKIDEKAQEDRINDAQQKIISLADAKDTKKVIASEDVALLLRNIPSRLAREVGLKKDLSHEKAKRIFELYGNGTVKDLLRNYKLATELSPGVRRSEAGRDASEEEVETVLGRKLAKDLEARREMLTTDAIKEENGAEKSDYALAA